MIYTFGQHNVKWILNQQFLAVPQQNQFCYFVSFVNMYPLPLEHYSTTTQAAADQY